MAESSKTHTTGDEIRHIDDLCSPSNYGTNPAWMVREYLKTARKRRWDHNVKGAKVIKYAEKRLKELAK